MLAQLDDRVRAKGARNLTPNPFPRGKGDGIWRKPRGGRGTGFGENLGPGRSAARFSETGTGFACAKLSEARSSRRYRSRRQGDIQIRSSAWPFLASLALSSSGGHSKAELSGVRSVMIALLDGTKSGVARSCEGCGRPNP